MKRHKLGNIKTELFYADRNNMRSMKPVTVGSNDEMSSDFSIFEETSLITEIHL